MKLSKIEPIATMTCGLFITREKDVCLDWNESEKAQKIIREEQEDMSTGEIHGLYTAEQMQDYAKECVREAYKETVKNSYVSDDRVERAGLNEIINKVFEEDTKND